MNLSALLENWKYSKKHCPTIVSLCKYMIWVYGRKNNFLKKRILRIALQLGSPIENVVLSVRCNHGSDFFIFSEVFKHRYYEFNLPHLPKTILDLGANIGFTGIYLSKKFPTAEVACVEPMPENIELLRENLSTNSANVKIIPKAISIEDGEITMEKASMDYGHKVHGIGFGNNIEGEVVTVGAITVPSIIHELKWDRIGLLKVDVEGYEGILLQQKCDWLAYVDAICIECHEGFGDGELATLAKKYGFSVPEKLLGVHLLIRKFG
jgi:FkbM family methyltransferase